MCTTCFYFVHKRDALSYNSNCQKNWLKQIFNALAKICMYVNVFYLKKDGTKQLDNPSLYTQLLKHQIS